MRNLDKFKKVMPAFQRIVVFGTLFVAIFVFIYSLIFMTPFSGLYQLDGSFNFTKMGNFEGLIDGFRSAYDITKYPNAYSYSPSSGAVIGANLAFFTSFTRNEFQVFNHWIFAVGFFAILASLVPIIYFSYKRKVYYGTNFVSIPIVATFNLYIAIHMLIQLISCHCIVNSQNYSIVNAYETYINDSSATTIINYYNSAKFSWVFVLGYFIVILLIVFAIGSYLLTFVKYKIQKSSPKIDLSQVKINE